MKPMLTVLAAALLAAPAASQEPAPLDLRQFDEQLAVAPTQMLVLGTPHLRMFAQEIDRPGLDQLLEPLMAKLEDFAPDTIAVEAISGSDCDKLVRYGEAFAGAADNYCRSTADAEAHTGLTRPQAEGKFLEILLDPETDYDDEKRRELAALFLAAGEQTSAVLQWLRLPEDQRVAGGMISEEMAEYLDGLAGSHNENVAIGVALALRLGHERIYHVDDHSADQLYLPVIENFGARMREIWSLDPYGARERYMGGIEKLKEDRVLLDFYRLLNDPEMQRLTVASDFALGLADDQGQGVGQAYANWWQVRNLRMVANLVAAASFEQSERTLAIVGASHKSYYDNYLDMMHHIERVDTIEFLAQ